MLLDQGKSKLYLICLGLQSMRTINFENIEYLKFGNQKQRQAFDTLTNHRVMEKLGAFDQLLT
jgi:hypothetical protein